MLKEAVDKAEYTEADLLAETEADSSQKYWQECAAKNRQVFAELSLNAAAPPEYLCDYIGMTVDEIAKIWGEDYEISSNLWEGFIGVRYADGRANAIFYIHDPVKYEQIDEGLEVALEGTEEVYMVGSCGDNTILKFHVNLN